MADKKITELTNITGANLVDADEFVVVDISADETKAITLGELKEAFDSGSGFVRITGDTMTGDLGLSGADITFGDNDKAIFGAGSDLQIYHDGSASYIDDAGSGRLNIRSNDLRIEKYTGETIAKFIADGAVELNYNDVKKLATTSTGISVTGDATFADNGKAIFGAGSDLQIYHNGTHSYIQDTGTGNLRIDGADIQLRDISTGNQYFLGQQSSGEARLYHSGSKTLATTSTGVDIFGTLTSDGLTVDGADTEATGSQLLKVRNSSTGEAVTIGLYAKADNSGDGNSGSITFDAGADGSAADNQLRFNADHQTSTNPALSIAGNGDISFYEDTGTTPKFFWDASAERLGIGTSSPSYRLDLGTVSNGTTVFNVTNGSNSNLRFKVEDGVSTIMNTGGSGALAFTSGGTTEHMRITSAGNVGIGTSSPAEALHVNSGTTNEVARFESTDGTAYLSIMDNSTSSSLQGIGSAGDSLTFYANSGERMRIDSSGRVGIGTSSPSDELEIASSSPAIRLTDTNDSTYGAVSYNVGALFLNGDQTIRFNTDGAEAMRIDSSGNLLVGKASASSSTVGFETKPTGFTAATRDGSTCLVLNRLTLDGEIVSFRRDGSTVGSIGHNGNIYLAGTSSGIRVRANDVIPATETGAANDNALDLGISTARFKDLYLSGDVITGGGGTGTTGEIQFVADSTRARIVGGYNSGGGGYIAFRTDTAGGTDLERARFNNAGNLAFTNGNGIDFSASQGSGASSSVLDDYEEGTWTPADGSGAGLTFSSVVANYTKIGRQVFIQCELQYPSTADVTDMDISGLPFAARDTFRFAGVMAYTTSTLAGSAQIINGTTTSIRFRQNGESTVLHNDDLSGITCRFTMVYHTNS